MGSSCILHRSSSHCLIIVSRNLEQCREGCIPQFTAQACRANRSRALGIGVNPSLLLLFSAFFKPRVAAIPFATQIANHTTRKLTMLSFFKQTIDYMVERGSSKQLEEITALRDQELPLYLCCWR